MNSNVRKLTDGAMMAAIIGAVLLIDRQTAGLISGYVMFLFPLPMVFYAAKYGLKDSLMVLAGIAVLSFILSTPATMYFVCCEALIGLVYGCGVHRRDDNKRILIRTLIMSVLTEVLALAVFAAFFGYDMTAEIGEYREILDTAFTGTGAEMPIGFDLENMVRTMFILSVILTGLLEGIVTHVLARVMLKRMRIALPESKRLVDMMPAKWTGYVALAGLVGFYYVMYHPLENQTLQMSVQAIGMISMMYLVVFGFIGIMVLGSLAYPNAAKYMPWIALGMTLLTSLGVTVIGFLYITTDLKNRLMKGRYNHASEND